MLFVPRSVLDKLHGLNIRMHVSEIAQHLFPGTPQTVIAASDFSVPDNGKCHLKPNRYGSNVTCRYPFQIPWRTTVQAQVTTAPCSNAGPTHPGFTSLMARSPGTGLNPIVQDLALLGGNLCPGTPVTFTAYHPGDNFRLELDIPSISLDQYLSR
jgi:hypothetical protein